MGGQNKHIFILTVHISGISVKKIDCSYEHLYTTRISRSVTQDELNRLTV